MDPHEALLSMVTIVALMIGVLGYNYVKQIPATECAKAGHEFTITANGEITCKK
jgi:hypothetical protein